MKGLKKGDIIYSSIVVCVCIVIIAAAWIFGDKIFFKESSSGNEEDITVYKTEDNYQNKNFASLVKDGALNIVDCGAVPNSTYDYGDLFRSAINTCLTTGAKLVLQEGTYYCSPEEGSTFLFDCSEQFADGFTIEGNGATIVNTDSFSGFFRFIESSGINVSGINFDYFYLPWVQAEVVSFNEDSRSLTLMTDAAKDNYCVFDDARYMDNIGDLFGVIRDSENPRLIDDERLNYFRISSVKKMGDQGYEVGLGTDTIAFGTKFDIGDKVVITNRRNASYSVFDIRTCGDVTISDVNAYSANGCLVLGQYMTGDITLNNANIIYGNNDERWITSNSDGVHMQAGSGKVIMNNCHFEGLCDDGVNIYQLASHVKEVISNNTFIIDGSELKARVVQNVGDTLIFYNCNTGETYGEAKVTALESVGGNSALIMRKVTVDKAINGVIAGKDGSSATHVYIKEQAFPGSEITNCTFNNIRGRGMLFRANKGVISGNTFKDISNHAIMSGGGAREGTYVDELKIVKNTITNCGYNHIEANSQRAGAIGIYMDPYSGSKQLAFPAHKNIEISENTFNDYHGRAIKLGNVAGATIKGNTFNADKNHHLYTENTAILINESSDVTVTGNKFDDAIDGVTGSIVCDSASTKNINFLDNVFSLPENKRIIKK